MQKNGTFFRINLKCLQNMQNKGGKKYINKKSQKCKKRVQKARGVQPIYKPKKGNLVQFMPHQVRKTSPKSPLKQLPKKEFRKKTGKT